MAKQYRLIPGDVHAYYDRVKDILSDKTPPNVPDYENDLAFEPKSEGQLPDIKIGQKLKIIIGDKAIDFECSAIFTNESARSKETTFMTNSTNTFMDEEVSVSIKYIKKKGA